ncbi:MAG: hypothetical protein AB7K52_01155 [Phycisphaerales bacterium]
MNPEAVAIILRPLIAPVLWSLALSWVCWRFLAPRVSAGGLPPASENGSGPRWSGALALALGLLFASFIDLGLAAALRWGEPRALPVHVAVLAGAFALLELLWCSRAPALITWLIRAAAAAGVLALALARYEEPAGLARAIIISGWAIGITAAWRFAETSARAAGPWSIAPALVAAALASPLLFSVSIAPGKAAMWLAGALGSILLAALFLRSRRVSIAGPALGVLWLTLGTMLLLRVHVNEDLPLWMAACVLASPAAAALASLPFIARRPRWLRGLAALFLAAAPILAALAVALPEAMRKAEGAY